jgi:arylsulfatase A
MKPHLLYGLAGLTLLAGCSEEKQPPNVIFIYADDLGIGDLSCYGATSIQTPNIDRLASEGLRFTNAYAAASVSTPSRYCLLTGQYPWRRNNTGIARGNSGMIIDTNQYTLADVFKDAGYATAVVGKWHLGLGGEDGPDWNNIISSGPQNLGFDYNFIIPATVDRVPCVFVEQDRVYNYDADDPIYVDYDKKIGDLPTGKDNLELLKLKSSHGHNQTIINGIGRIGYMTGGKSAIWVDENIADTLISKSQQFILKNKDNPFFLYLCPHDIHVPRPPHPRFAGKSIMGARGDVILQLDYTVSKIIEILDSLDITENTIIIFSSDNGGVVDDGYQDMSVELLGTHKPSGIYRGGKYSAFEAGTKVPLIIKWATAIKSGTQDALFSQVDFIASLANLANITLPEEACPDSQNHLSNILGYTSEDRDYVIQQNQWRVLSVIEGKWKYIPKSFAWKYDAQTNIELGHDTVPQLYNLETDPGETTNVAIEHPEIIERLSAIIK